jgi:[ribosomal protein S18]-alanine N-acetyltransferase
MRTFSIRIVKCTEDCFDALIDVLRLNTPLYFSESEEVDFIRYLSHELEDYYVAIYDDRVVGGGGINYPEEGTTAVISWDLIHPEFQRKSIGSSLLKHRINRIGEIETIKKIVVRTSQFTYKFYQKHGFSLLYVIEDYWDKGFDLFYMERLSSN